MLSKVKKHEDGKIKEVSKRAQQAVSLALDEGLDLFVDTKSPASFLQALSSCPWCGGSGPPANKHAALIKERIAKVAQTEKDTEARSRGIESATFPLLWSVTTVKVVLVCDVRVVVE